MGPTAEIEGGRFELTEQQLHLMQTFGFLHLPDLLTDKIAPITVAFEEMIAAHGGGVHEGEAQLSVAPFLNHHPYLCTLLDDHRIDGIARGLCGDDYQCESRARRRCLCFG